jgi:saccharopine dehydrogenase-like NADP-dependent oxidoreductase
MRITVLGGGMVGRTIAKDLAAAGSYQVVVADRSSESLRRAAALGLPGMEADLSQAGEVERVIEGSGVVVNAVPGFMGHATLETVIRAGIDVVDIAFMPEDPVDLDPLAKSKGVTAVVDFGVAPGLSNLLTGRGASLLDRTTWVEILVGGLPKVRTLPWEYAAPFSPVDVLEEYTRVARLVEHGQVVTRPALSQPELVNLPRVGTLEAFNTDGLRSLIRTIDCPDMREKTLRYPGYVQKVKLLIESGFFSSEPVTVGGVSVKPFDLTAALLFRQWELKDDQEEFTVMRVEVAGVKDGAPRRYIHDLYDEYDRATGASSMSRTTGFPAAIMARLLARKEYVNPGVIPPETVGRDPKVFQYLIEALAARGVSVKETVGQ